MQTLWLASTSPWRRRLLEAAGVTIQVEGSEVDERAISIDDPVELARDLALRKARAVAGRHPGEWVLGSDQVGFDLEDRLPFGKPDDPADHLRRLRSLVGRTHALVTAVALVRAGPGGEEVVEHEISLLKVRADLAPEELAAYVRTGEGSGCAGGYAVEGLGSFLFESIEGDWFNVVGLPLLRVTTLLRARGWRFQGQGR